MSTAQKPTAVTHALSCRFDFNAVCNFCEDTLLSSDRSLTFLLAPPPPTLPSLAGSSSIQDAPLHLVVVKGTWLEIHLVNQINPSSGSGDGDNDDDDASAGLSLLCEAPLYGTVAVLQKFRPEGEPQDRLLIVTVCLTLYIHEHVLIRFHTLYVIACSQYSLLKRLVLSPFAPDGPTCLWPHRSGTISAYWA